MLAPTVLNLQDPEERLRAIAEGVQPAISTVVDFPPDDPEEVYLSVNLEEEANNRIRDYIGSQFHGHEFTRLVAAVLQGQGYAAEVAPPGPDGGVDIVAGSGPMGFDPPRICVQVKAYKPPKSMSCGNSKEPSKISGPTLGCWYLGADLPEIHGAKPAKAPTSTCAYGIPRRS